MAHKAAFLCASVGCSWRGSIALLWVLRCETLICEDWIESDLDVHRGLGEPTVQPEPLETDMVVDGRPPALQQVSFWIGPIQRVKENWAMNAVTEVQRAHNKCQDCGMGRKKKINVQVEQLGNDDGALAWTRVVASAKVQKVGKGLPRQRWPLPRQSYDYTGRGSTYTRAYKASTTLPPFETFADGLTTTNSSRHPRKCRRLRELCYTCPTSSWSPPNHIATGEIFLCGCSRRPTNTTGLQARHSPIHSVPVVQKAP